MLNTKLILPLLWTTVTILKITFFIFQRKTNKIQQLFFSETQIILRERQRVLSGRIMQHAKRDVIALWRNSDMPLCCLGNVKPWSALATDMSKILSAFQSGAYSQVMFLFYYEFQYSSLFSFSLYEHRLSYRKFF